MSAIAIAVAGAAVAAGGQVYASLGQAHAADFQAKVEQNNAKAAGYAADAATIQGKIQQQQLQQRTAQVSSEQQAALAANDVSLGSGDSVSLAESTAGMGERDILISQYNTALNRWGYKNQQQAYLAQAGLLRSQATTDIIAGGVNAAGSLLSSASKFNTTTAGLSSFAANFGYQGGSPNLN